MSQELLIHLTAVPQRTLTAPDLIEEFKQLVSLKTFKTLLSITILIHQKQLQY